MMTAHDTTIKYLCEKLLAESLITEDEMLLVYQIVLNGQNTDNMDFDTTENAA